MIHLEFYVLWEDGTWTVEGVNVEDHGTVEENIHVGREGIRLMLGRAPYRLEVVGPVHGYQPIKS